MTPRKIIYTECIAITFSTAAKNIFHHNIETIKEHHGVTRAHEHLKPHDIVTQPEGHEHATRLAEYFDIAFQQQYPEITKPLHNGLSLDQLCQWLLKINDHAYSSTISLFEHSKMAPMVNNHYEYALYLANSYINFFFHRTSAQVLSKIDSLSPSIITFICKCLENYDKKIASCMAAIGTRSIQENAKIAHRLFTQQVSLLMTHPLTESEVTEKSQLVSLALRFSDPAREEYLPTNLWGLIYNKGSLSQPRLKKIDEENTIGPKLIGDALSDALQSYKHQSTAPSHQALQVAYLQRFSQYLSTDHNLSLADSFFNHHLPKLTHNVTLSTDHLIHYFHLFASAQNENDYLQYLHMQSKKGKIQSIHADFLWRLFSKTIATQDFMSISETSEKHQEIINDLKCYIANHRHPQSDAFDAALQLLSLSSPSDDYLSYHFIGAIAQGKIESGVLKRHYFNTTHKAIYRALAELRYADQENSEYLIAKLGFTITQQQKIISKEAYTLALSYALSQLIASREPIDAIHFHQLSPMFSRMFSCEQNTTLSFDKILAYCGQAIETHLARYSSRVLQEQAETNLKTELVSLFKELNLTVDDCTLPLNAITRSGDSLLEVLKESLLSCYQDPRTPKHLADPNLPKAPRGIVSIIITLENPTYDSSQKETIIRNQATKKTAEKIQHLHFQQFKVGRAPSTQQFYCALAQHGVEAAIKALLKNPSNEERSSTTRASLILSL